MASKRLRKKYATTGRTAGYQPIGKKALDRKVRDIKSTPRPKSPKVDHAAKAAADERRLQQEHRMKQFLTDMITSGEDFLIEEVGLSQNQIDAIKDGIYYADEDTLNSLIDILQNDDGSWKDFYLFLSDSESGYLDNEEYTLAIQLVMDELGIEY